MRIGILVTILSLGFSGTAIASPYAGNMAYIKQSLNDQRESLLKARHSFDREGCVMAVEDLATGRLQAMVTAINLGENPAQFNDVQILSSKETCGISFVDYERVELRRKFTGFRRGAEEVGDFGTFKHCDTYHEEVEAARAEAVHGAYALGEDSAPLKELAVPSCR